MELLQVFMGSSLDSVCTLETRVHGLERIIYEMAQDQAAVSTGRPSSCVEAGALAMEALHKQVMPLLL